MQRRALFNSALIRLSDVTYCRGIFNMSEMMMKAMMPHMWLFLFAVRSLSSGSFRRNEWACHNTQKKKCKLELRKSETKVFKQGYLSQLWKNSPYRSCPWWCFKKYIASPALHSRPVINWGYVYFFKQHIRQQNKLTKAEKCDAKAALPEEGIDIWKDSRSAWLKDT